MHIWSTVTLPVYFRAHSRQSFNRKQKRKERNKQTNTKNRRPFNFVMIYFVFHFWNGRVISTRCARRALILNPFWCELYSLPVNAIKPTVSFVNSKKKNTQSRRWEASRKKKKKKKKRVAMCRVEDKWDERGNLEKSNGLEKSRAVGLGLALTFFFSGKNSLMNDISVSVTLVQLSTFPARFFFSFFLFLFF